MPPAIRALVYEFGYPSVASLCNQGITNPRAIRHLIVSARKRDNGDDT